MLLRVETERQSEVRLQAAFVELVEDDAGDASSEGSACSVRVRMPSVMTSIRVCGPITRSRRVRKPTVAPSGSRSNVAMRAATARAATRRGSSSTMRLPPVQSASRRCSGTSVLLPAPGGASTITLVCVSSAVDNAGNAATIGRSRVLRPRQACRECNGLRRRTTRDAARRDGQDAAVNLPARVA